jgi:hypothetical protein
MGIRTVQGSAQKESGRQRFAAKDVVTMAVSFMAIGLSVVTFYFTVLRRSEALSMIPETIPFALYSDDEKKLTLTNNDMKVTFINSGNRPIGVLDIDVAYLLQTNARRRGCDSVMQRAGDILFGTSFRPFVIKENEVSIQQVRVTGASTTNDGKFIKPAGGEREIPPPGEMTNKYFDIEVCILIKIASPALARVNQEVSVDEYTLVERGYKPKGGRISRLGEAILIHKHEGTIFSP